MCHRLHPESKYCISICLQLAGMLFARCMADNAANSETSDMIFFALAQTARSTATVYPVL